MRRTSKRNGAAYLRGVNRILPVISLLLLAGCTSAPSGKGTAHTAPSLVTWLPPPAGTVVAADSMKIAEGVLNNAYFSVRLTVHKDFAGEQHEAFAYDIHASYGHAVADGSIVMPYGGQNLKPLLRKGDGYSYIVGFIPGPDYGGDTAFHAYYRITGGAEHIGITPLKGFSVE